MAKTAHRATRSAQGLQTFFELRNGSVFVGSVADPARPTERFTVELLVDGLVIMAAYADQYTQRGEKNRSATDAMDLHFKSRKPLSKMPS